MGGCEHGRFRFDELIVHGDDLFTAAAFVRLSMVVRVGQKILQGAEQEGAQAAFFTTGAGESLLFE